HTFSNAGTYELIWSNGFCEDRITIIVNDFCDCPNGVNSVNGPVKTNACTIFPSMTLSGVNSAPTGGDYQWFYEFNNGMASLVATTQDYTTGDLLSGNHKFLRIYRLNANGQNCVYNSNVIGIDVYPDPEALISGDNKICEGTSTIFSAAGGVDYLWSNG